MQEDTMTTKKTDAAEPLKAAAEATTATVKTFTQLGADTYGKVLAEMEKGVSRSHDEAQRLWDESLKLGEMSMKASQDLTKAMFDNAKRFQSLLG